MAGNIHALRPATVRSAALDLTPVVAELRYSRDVQHNIRLSGKVTEVPSVTALAEALDSIAMSLFPTHLGPHGLNHDSIDLFVTNALSTAFTRLSDQIARGLRFDIDALQPPAAQLRAEAILHGFAKQLPTIRAMLVSDLRAARRRDPSAGSLAEVLICQPCSRAVIHHRIAHALHEQGARFVARIVSALAHSTTGIDIDPGARIGPGFFIRKGMGVSIGETAVIGENVCLHQGVTLGEDESEYPIPQTRRRVARHPIIEDNVVIHAGATILGRITVGAGSVIGGNVWLTRSVPPGSSVLQAAHAVSSIQNLD